MNTSLRIKSVLFALFFNSILASGQQRPPAAEVAGIPVNYDETLIGSYSLPDVLALKNGKKVKDAKEWNRERRPEILRLYEEEQFGKMPPKPSDLRFEVFDKGTSAFSGKVV